MSERLKEIIKDIQDTSDKIWDVVTNDIADTLKKESISDEARHELSDKLSVIALHISSIHTDYAAKSILSFERELDNMRSIIEKYSKNMESIRDSLKGC